MSAAQRLAKIEGLLAAEPADPFLKYALAMELEKDGQHARSLEPWRELMSGSPPHITSFHMAAKSLVRQGQAEEARAVLRVGIEEARRQGKSHAASEMSELLTHLGGGKGG